MSRIPSSLNKAATAVNRDTGGTYIPDTGNITTSILPVVRGGTGVTTSTGRGSVVS